MHRRKRKSEAGGSEPGCKVVAGPIGKRNCRDDKKSSNGADGTPERARTKRVKEGQIEESLRTCEQGWKKKRCGRGGKGEGETYMRIR